MNGGIAPCAKVGALVKEHQDDFEKTKFNLVIKFIESPSLSLEIEEWEGIAWNDPDIPRDLARLLSELKMNVMSDNTLKLYEQFGELTGPSGNFWVLGGDGRRYDTGSSDRNSVFAAFKKLKESSPGVPPHGLESGRSPLDPQTVNMYKDAFLKHVHAIFDPDIEYGLNTPDPPAVYLRKGFFKLTLPIMKPSFTPREIIVNSDAYLEHLYQALVGWTDTMTMQRSTPLWNNAESDNIDLTDWEGNMNAKAALLRIVRYVSGDRLHSNEYVWKKFSLEQFYEVMGGYDGWIVTYHEEHRDPEEADGYDSEDHIEEDERSVRDEYLTISRDPDKPPWFPWRDE